MSTVAKVPMIDYRQAVSLAMDLINAKETLRHSPLIILKPNLTNDDPPPVTTPVECVAAVAAYCRQHCNGQIIIGEGCGFGQTADTFAANGYQELAARENLRLVDFNTEKTITLKHPQASQLRQFEMPAILQNATVISIPVLKDHSFTTTTIAMKNMFGIAPASFYRGNWNKSALHHPSTHQSVVDICLYKKPAICLIDAVNALTGMHLAGTVKHLGCILASRDPVAADAVGSTMLGHEPNDIEYLTAAEGKLGTMHDIELLSTDT